MNPSILGKLNIQGFYDVELSEFTASGSQPRVVDVREPDEYYGDLGHLDNAELVPLATLAAAASNWYRDAPLILVCRSGARSSRASAALVQMGFSRVMNLLGGMLAVRT